MNYEIVHLEEKFIEGLSIRTANSDPNVGEHIGGLWQKFYSEGIYSSIPKKKNDKSICIYTNYSNNNDKYDVIIGCEKTNKENSMKKTVNYNISSGKYAKFIVIGDPQKDIIEFWKKLWEMKLDRKFDCDFEEYQNNDPKNAIVHIYISLN